METHCRTLAGAVLAGEMGDAMVACATCKRIEQFLRNIEDDAFNVAIVMPEDLIERIKANATRATELLAMEHE